MSYARVLIPALWNHWIEVPDDQAAKEEIRMIHHDLVGSRNTEQAGAARSFFGRIVWPLLVENKLTQEQSVCSAKLTKPKDTFSSINC